MLSAACTNDRTLTRTKCALIVGMRGYSINLAAGSAVLAYRPGSADLNESSSETTGWVGISHGSDLCQI